MKNFLLGLWNVLVFYFTFGCISFTLLFSPALQKAGEVTWWVFLILSALSATTVAMALMTSHKEKHRGR